MQTTIGPFDFGIGQRVTFWRVGLIVNLFDVWRDVIESEIRLSVFGTGFGVRLQRGNGEFELGAFVSVLTLTIGGTLTLGNDPPEDDLDTLLADIFNSPPPAEQAIPLGPRTDQPLTNDEWLAQQRARDPGLDFILSHTLDKGGPAFVIGLDETARFDDDGGR